MEARRNRTGGRIAAWFAVCLLLAVAGYFGVMVCIPAYRWLTQNTGYWGMIAECAGWFAVLFLLIWRLRPALAAAACAALAGAFAYVHVLALPALAAAAYGASLVIAGRAVRRAAMGNCHAHPEFFDLLIGLCLSALTGFLLSALGVGTPGNIRLAWAAVSLVALLALTARRSPRVRAARAAQRPEAWQAALMALVLTCVLMALGRCNGAADYDSYWYGFRPEYALAAGEGVFEDLGLIALVFWYTKLYEIVMLPLSGLPSFAFLAAGNVMLGCWMLYTLYQLVKLAADRDRALLAAAIAGCIPGIAVMFIHTKTDMITLLLQLMMTYFAACHVKGEGRYNLAGLFGAYLFSLGCKPTSVVFSSLLLLALGAALLAGRGRSERRPGGWRGLACALPAALALLLALLRTWRITGMPMNSFGGVLFSRLGFAPRSPYSLHPAGSGEPPRAGLLTPEGLLNAVTRELTFWFWPGTEDMSHVHLAWGGPLVLLLCVLLAGALFTRAFRRRLREAPVLKPLYAAFSAMLFASLGAIAVLEQVDGNYFILLYALSAALAAVMLAGREQARAAALCLCPLFAFGFLFSGLSGWTEVKEFARTAWVNAGYYDDRAESEALWRGQCPKIMDVLAAERGVRVAVAADHTLEGRLPFVSEDIMLAYYQGDAGILDSAEALHAYLIQTGKDYVLTCRDQLDYDDMLSLRLSEMFEAGLLEEPLYEDGWMLAAVRGEAAADGDSALRAALFWAEAVRPAPGRSIETARRVSGIDMSDMWLMQSAELTIRTGYSGVIALRGYYPLEATGGETITCTVNGEPVLRYTLTGNSFFLEIPAPKNEIVVLGIEAPFRCNDENSEDVRALSFIISELYAL